MKNIEIIKIRNGSAANPAGYMVKVGNVVIGFLDKYANTRTETHPWKAFAAKKDASGNYVYAGEIAFQCFYGTTGKAKAVSFLQQFYPQMINAAK